MKLFSWLSFFCLTLGSSHTFGATRSNTPNLDLIEQKIKEGNVKTLEDVLSSLPSEMRKRYSLVYESRSLQSASLEKPRVILRSEDNQFFLAFSSSDSIARAGDQTFECFENYGPNQITFARIDLSNTQKLQIERNPKQCAFCHDSGNAAHGIIEGYPHWAGFYGSSHNGRAYGEGSGSARLPQWEFEQNALKNFIINQSNRPFYRTLNDLKEQSIQKLSSQNAILGTALIYSLQSKQNNQIYEQIHSVEELKDAVMLSRPLPNIFSSANDGWGSNELYPEILTEEKFKPYLNFIQSEMPQYRMEAKRVNDEKFDHLKGIVLEYGTSRDKTLIEEAKPFSAVEKFQATYQPYPPNRTDLGINLPLVLNYFDEMEQFSYPALFYSFFIQQHQITKPIKLNNLLEHRSIRTMTGATTGELLTGSFSGFEDFIPSTTSFTNARNYRDFEELMEWIPSPFKLYAWVDLKKFPILEQKTIHYFDSLYSLISQSPLLRLNQNQQKINDIVRLPGFPETLKEKYLKLNASQSSL